MIVVSNDGSGGKFKGGLGGNIRSCGGNAGKGGSIARRGEGSLAKRLMESKNGLGGGGEECLDGWVGTDRGEVKGGGVDFGVCRTLLGEILGEIIRESGGEHNVVGSAGSIKRREPALKILGNRRLQEK
nr:hypothetical protein [Tanacetum cinerariifolium]